GIGVIDRNMYLRFNPKETEFFKNLFENRKKGRELLSEFLDLVLETKKERGFIKNAIKRKIEWKLGKEWIVSLGRMDSFSAIRTIIGSLADENIEIPLKYQIIIRNIKAIQKLAKTEY
ncbi:MAG: hypothetical protein WA019_03385, partial [Candidatus Moraniibacteriota bacterium]